MFSYTPFHVTIGLHRKRISTWCLLSLRVREINVANLGLKLSDALITQKASLWQQNIAELKFDLLITT